MPSTLGDCLRAARRSANLTQEQLAVTAGLTTASVSRIEGGRNENPRLETLRALARVLRIEVAALLPHEENDASK